MRGAMSLTGDFSEAQHLGGKDGVVRAIVRKYDCGSAL